VPLHFQLRKKYNEALASDHDSLFPPTPVELKNILEKVYEKCDTTGLRSFAYRHAIFGAIKNKEYFDIFCDQWKGSKKIGYGLLTEITPAEKKVECVRQAIASKIIPHAPFDNIIKKKSWNFFSKTDVPKYEGFMNDVMKVLERTSDHVTTLISNVDSEKKHDLCWTVLELTKTPQAKMIVDNDIQTFKKEMSGIEIGSTILFQFRLLFCSNAHSNQELKGLWHEQNDKVGYLQLNSKCEKCFYNALTIAITISNLSQKAFMLHISNSKEQLQLEGRLQNTTWLRYLACIDAAFKEFIPAAVLRFLFSTVPPTLSQKVQDFLKSDKTNLSKHLQWDSHIPQHGDAGLIRSCLISALIESSKKVKTSETEPSSPSLSDCFSESFHKMFQSIYTTICIPVTSCIYEKDATSSQQNDPIDAIVTFMKEIVNDSIRRIDTTIIHDMTAPAGSKKRKRKENPDNNHSGENCGDIDANNGNDNDNNSGDDGGGGQAAAEFLKLDLSDQNPDPHPSRTNESPSTEVAKKPTTTGPKPNSFPPSLLQPMTMSTAISLLRLNGGSQEFEDNFLKFMKSLCPFATGGLILFDANATEVIEERDQVNLQLKHSSQAATVSSSQSPPNSDTRPKHESSKKAMNTPPPKKNQIDILAGLMNS
jgi:hypothetical protein